MACQYEKWKSVIVQDKKKYKGKVSKDDRVSVNKEV